MLEQKTQTILEKIVATKHREIEADKRVLSFADVEALAAKADPVRGFANAIVSRIARKEAAVIAEIKKASPSKGLIRADFDPASHAADYAANGAACLSVLTDRDYFQGHDDYLVAARSACTIPVIRKDFIVDRYQVAAARAMGADCVLLIAAALSQPELVAFHQLATEIGLDVLVETHDEAEVERALSVGATMIGVNQRDLMTFQVDHERAVRMAAEIPNGVVKIAESGVRDANDAQSLRNAGYDAVLVGESLVVSNDPAAAIALLHVTTTKN